jgi:arylsulfatase A-like enzyme
MSYYTGRYVSSHGATWNNVPLSIVEHTLGDYLRAAGRTATLAGKTHVVPDTEAFARCGIEVESERGALLREGGFVSIDRYDGHLPPGRESGYADFLRAHGYASADPWSDYVIAAEEGGRVVSGWQMRHAHLPSRVREEHSETAYLTDRALDWISAQGEAPWVLHLSYVKPHWPYLAPAPYHALYRGGDLGPIVRGAQDGTAAEHPVMRAYRQHDEALSFARAEVACHVRATYMGLIAQVDHHLGRVLEALAAQGRMDDTLIVFTSDHGEFSGDRGLGEKELFHDEIVRVPFIVCDPDPRADGTRGSTDTGFVEGIDVVPTILAALGIPGATHRIEGVSLLPRLRGEVGDVARDAVYAELDYGLRRARKVLHRGVGECRAFMVCTALWKYVHWEGFRPQLFDLVADPGELCDLGADPRRSAERARLAGRLFDWLATRKRRTTLSEATADARTDTHRQRGIHIGIW